MIHKGEAGWCLTQAVEEMSLEMPDSVKGMVERKINRLADEDHRLLQAASIQGFEFDSAVVGRVGQLEDETVEERLQALERDHRFVHLTGEDEFPDRTLTLRYRFVHALYQNELYDSLARTKRARLSRAAAEALESMYGQRRSDVASRLASLYETARDFEKAVDYFGKASEHAAGVFAHQEAATLANRGLKLLDALSESQERDQRELLLQAYLGGSLSAIRGYADDGVGVAYMRVRELSKKLGLDSKTAVAVSGLIPFFNVTVQLQSNLDLCQELLELAQAENDRLLLCTAHSGLGMAEQFLGNFGKGQTHLERVVELDKIQRQDSDASMAGWEAVIYTLGHLAFNDWVLGFPDRAIKHSVVARSRAEESGNPFNLAHSLGFAGFLHQNRGDVDKVLELGEECIALSQENAYHLNMAWATMQKGWSVSAKGELQEGLAMIQQGLRTWRAVGMIAMVPYWHILIAEIYGQLNQPEEGLAHLSESIDIVDNTDHRFYEAELYRTKGELLLQDGAAEPEAVSCYEKALEIARAQQARSYELRAATGLSRLWQRQGKDAEAKALLNSVYSWFTEGFETRDLQKAKQLLTELS